VGREVVSAAGADDAAADYDNVATFAGDWWLGRHSQLFFGLEKGASEVAIQTWLLFLGNPVWIVRDIKKGTVVIPCSFFWTRSTCGRIHGEDGVCFWRFKR
jgi:hypothetical protein